MRPLILALGATLICATSATAADEPIRTAPQAGPPPTVTAPAEPGAVADPEGQAIAEWGRRVLANEPVADGAASRAPAKGCARSEATDRKPHGEVWGGIGTRGYREIGGVVTQPLGACGSVTIAVDRMQGGDFRRRR